MNLLPQTRNYLQKFVRAKGPDYSRIYYEYRPGKGYGHFYRSDEVYQTMIDIYFNLTENFNDLSMPEVFSSPKALMAKMTWFVEILKRRSELFETVGEHFQDEHLSASDAAVTIDNVRLEVIDAFENALKLAEEEMKAENEKENDADQKLLVGKEWYQEAPVRAAFITGSIALVIFILTQLLKERAPITSPVNPANQIDTVSKPIETKDPTLVEMQETRGRQEESEKARVELRKASSLRALTPAETNLSLKEMARGTYGFIYGSELREKEGSLKRIASGFTFEIHKSASGGILVVGFVNDDAAALLNRESRSETIAVALYADYWESATRIVSIPMASLDSGFRIRDIELGQYAKVSAADVKIAPKLTH
jgi:hypothetical protein